MDERQAQFDRQFEDPRVRLAAERTHLAWMRTALALMGFGFVVARFGLFLREIAVVGHEVPHEHATGWSLWIGTALIAVGVVISLVASYEYYGFVQSSKRGRLHMPRTAVLAVGVAGILAILGVVMALYLILLSR
jgi:putative membrane protein